MCDFPPGPAAWLALQEAAPRPVIRPLRFAALNKESAAAGAAADFRMAVLLLARQDVVVDLRSILFIERAGDDVEACRHAAGFHGCHRQRDVAGCLRIL